MARVRHHTDDAGLEKIWNTQQILPARGSEGAEAGVHVEVEPFQTTQPGMGGPRAEMGCYAEGAFVEFDAPRDILPTKIGPRNTAIIPRRAEEPLSLVGRNPYYVKVRRYWWEFWRARME